MSKLLYFAVPAFVILLLIELVITTRRRLNTYESKDAWTSLALGTGNVIIHGLTKGVMFVIFFYLYEHRLFELGTGWLAWVGLIIAEDFTYYWFHRMHHEVRFFWAAHVNHHSSQYYNFATALRQSLTTPFTGPVFWFALPLVGFHPLMVMTAQSVSLIYQFWIHTELIDKLGPLEWVMNTPSHHRVHHGRNVQYLDRNYAGIFIIWDRLFGTFEPEAEPVDYGLTKNIHTFNLIRVGFHEWIAMFRDAWRAPRWREKFGYLFQPPGWSPDRRTLTARQMQRERFVTPA